jgi:transcriptional regulator with XRE-family HTH domain
VSLDKEQEQVRKLLAAKLRAFREGAGVGVEELAKAVKRGRQYIWLVEEGKANFTINNYIHMLDECGVSFADAVSAYRSSDIPEAHQDFYALLAKILKSENPKLLDGLRETLQAFAEKSARLQKEKTRGDPNPSNGRGKDPTEGIGTGRPRRRKTGA